MDPNQIDGGERCCAAPCWGTNSVLPVLLESRTGTSQPPRAVWGVGGIRVGRRRFSASAASLLGRQDRFGDFFSPMRLAAGFPPRSFLTQSVLQRVHHHLVDHQVPLIGSEREKHESEELFFGAPLNGCDNFDFGILKLKRLLGFVDTRCERGQNQRTP